MSAHTVKHLQIAIPDELYDELRIAAADAAELDELDVHISPEQFAAECVESVLATRRLDRIAFV